MNRYLKIGLMTPGWFWLLVLSGLIAAGCASTKQSEALNPPAPTEFDKRRIANLDGDRLAVGDLVILEFSGAKGLIPSHQEHIKKDGTITLPLIGAVKVEGKTPGELFKEIHDRYVPRYYERLVITFGGPSVYYVEGHVSSPGRRVCPAGTTLMKAIQSESLTAQATMHRIELIRASGETIEVDYFNPGSLGLQVFPGDKIIVPMRGSWDVYQQ